MGVKRQGGNSAMRFNDSTQNRTKSPLDFSDIEAVPMAGDQRFLILKEGYLELVVSQ